LIARRLISIAADIYHGVTVSIDFICFFKPFSLTFISGTGYLFITCSTRVPVT